MRSIVVLCPTFQRQMITAPSHRSWHHAEMHAKAKPARTRLPRSSQSGAYFEQSADALTQAGSPNSLWVDAPEYYNGSLLEGAQRRMTASNRRIGFLRSSVLFSALAAEAYANEFLAETLTTKDADAADRLATPDKLLLGPNLAGLLSPLERGCEPFQSIAQLFSVRNQLVHPRRDGPSAWVMDITDDDERHFGPVSAGKFFVAVAKTIIALDELLPRGSRAGHAKYVTRCPQAVDEHVKAIGKTILDVPAENASEPVHLMEQARRRAMKKNGKGARKGGGSRKDPPGDQ